MWRQKVLSTLIKKKKDLIKKISTSAGFEPAREIPIDNLEDIIRVNRLNHSAIMPNIKSYDFN